MRTSTRFGVGAALGTWLADVVLLATSHGQAKTWQWVSGAGAALFVLLSSTVVVCLPLGPAFAWLTRNAAGRPSWLAVFRNDALRVRRVLTTEFTIVGMLGIWSWLAYHATIGIEFAVARPDARAGALTLLSWAFLAIFDVGWPWCHAVARAVFDRAARTPGLRWLLSRIWPVNALLAMATGLAATRLLPHDRLDTSVIPWHYAISLGGLVSGVVYAACVPLLTRPGAVRLRRVLRVLFATAVLLGAGIAFRLRPEWSVVRTLAFDRALSGRMGYAAWTLAFDFDRDGQLGILGGGDCAPFDPKRYMGAVETIDNGVDEDCDGADLTRQSLDPRPRIAVGQERQPKRPTVVLITVDALSAPKLTRLGGPASLMPNLDELAGRSDFSRDYYEQNDLYAQQAWSPEVMRLKSLLGAFIERFSTNSRSSAGAPRSTDPIFQIAAP
jgi:hypothetical protein